MRTDYKTCPHCGANLDIGERCDCRNENGAQEGTQKPFKSARHRNLPLKDKNAIRGKIRT